MVFALELLATGLAAGILGALLGLGGGIFLVPALTLLFDLPIRTTVGTSLVAVIATSAGVAAVAPPGRGADVGLALRLEVATATSNFMVGITAAASVFIYYGRGDIHPLVVIPTALGVFAGAILGVYLLPRVRVSWLRLALIGLLVFMGVQMLMKGLQA
jgi:uncharacterized membrane protein YfcA